MEARVGIEPAYTELQDEPTETIFYIKTSNLQKLLPSKTSLTHSL